ncbi:hypothetical protein DIPPA_08034 [Diplonema papillatum]|nr:hypothetical protein DIPPA_08034 [Diplonema papillatum]|eukprot:gene19616-30218_t
MSGDGISGRLTEEEEAWLMQQIEQEEDDPDDDSDEDEDPQAVEQQFIVGGEHMAEGMEAEMLHFLNSTGQECARAVGSASNSEKRYDTDGQLYTKEDFIAFYSSLEQWNTAVPEKRQDTDGNCYSFSEFLDFYGEVDAVTKWSSGRPQTVCSYFQQGNCTYGDTCRSAHVGGARPPHPGYMTYVPQR